MENKTLLKIAGIAILAGLLIDSLRGAVTFAAEDNHKVRNAETAIAENQQWFSAHRSEKETCDQLDREWRDVKDNNILQVGILEGQGYRYDWANNKAVENLE